MLEVKECYEVKIKSQRDYHSNINMATKNDGIEKKS